jgi:hypothetical protein
MKIHHFILCSESDGIQGSKDEGMNTRFGRESRQSNPMEGSWLKSLLCDATSGLGGASRASKMEGMMFMILFFIFTTEKITETQNALGLLGATYISSIGVSKPLCYFHWLNAYVLAVTFPPSMQELDVHGC